MSETSNQTFDKELNASGLRFVIVVSRFNSFVTEPLLNGALDALKQHGAEESRIEVLRVPGAWEIPVIARAVAARQAPDAIICLGAVIRGGTPHFDYVAGEAARGIADASAQTGIPMAFGLLTTDDEQQAIDRAGGKHGNKGFDAALTAIEMANLLRDLRTRS